MTDHLSRAARSRNMSRIRSVDTSPELLVRSLLRKFGYRYHLHVDSLPGSPDIVFPKRKKAVFVHGCYWHRHRCRRGQSLPSTNVGFWEKKFEKNKQRDRSARLKLRRKGWRCLIIWECQLKDLSKVNERLRKFFE